MQKQSSCSFQADVFFHNSIDIHEELRVSKTYKRECENGTGGVTDKRPVQLHKEREEGITSDPSKLKYLDISLLGIWDDWGLIFHRSLIPYLKNELGVVVFNEPCSVC
jgi:hypothetical protein